MVKMNKEKVFSLLNELEGFGVHIRYPDAKLDFKDKIKQLRNMLK